MKKVSTITLFWLGITSVTLQAETTDIIQITKPGDGQMSCEQITTEIYSMDAVINQSNSSKSANELAGIGTSVAGHLAGFFGGGVGAVVATGGANSVIGKNKQSAEERMKAAEQRRTMLMGIYAGKGCETPE